ncbi:MAG: hypothetical protein GY926_18610, partial [bacterium]|nr:hypothetical protein [bacterium]
GGWELKVLQEAGTALDWPVLLRGHPFEWEQGEAVTVERRASGLFTAAQVTLSPAGVVFDGTDNCCPECGRLLGTGHKLDCGQRASHNEPNAEEAGQ